MKDQQLLIHQIDLGKPIPPEERGEILRMAAGQPAVMAVLQMLRDQACIISAAGRQPPAALACPGDFRAYHDGGADALEEVFTAIWQAGQQGPDGEDGEG